MIVDASIVVKWFTAEPLHEEALMLRIGAEPLLAPDILSAEFANAIWAKARRSEIEEAAAVSAIAAVSGRGQPQLQPTTPLVPRAFELARTLDHPVYDCIYIALAERLNTVLMTADRRLADAARSLLYVRLLGEPEKIG